ncbi:LPS export ABC transporter periplasmic protein LptC [Candidatus Erwinia haradaeae]|uniref:Lipopolysaccharide export system protein LptC n=1 Tax=Candidatus Erwinia haradaeae TaxID=1922217 RepID=A0A451D4X6_9GAMM|nr:LPS export ABC transporter periplasmic protein LptC [Candidatus Erwinia haradaeae]VFP80744.1 Lipopolysaccharide export system protein LptC [Candidatus Erwinia haradaeae]
MSKIKNWMITLIAFIVTLLIFGILITHNNIEDIFNVSNHANEPIYISTNLHVLLYNSNGSISYHIMADKAQYYSNHKISCFIYPMIEIYDDTKFPAWNIHANQAKLTHDNMLYLYGNILVNSLSNETEIKQIKTNKAIVNLVTQDIIAKDSVTLYGRNFQSTSAQIHGNLRKKTAELIGQVKTSYEIKNKSRNHKSMYKRPVSNA